MEHVHAGLVVAIAELQNSPLALALHDRVDCPQSRGKCRSVIVVVEEVAMEMEGIEEIELQDVHQIDADGPRVLNADGMFRKVMSHGVDGIDLVLAIQVGVETVHNHDELLPLLVLGSAKNARTSSVRMLGVPRWVGIDDEGAVHPLVDVTS